MSVDSNFALEVDLPRMSDPDKKEIVSTQSASSAIKVGQYAALVMLVILPLAFKTELKSILSTIRSLSVIVHMFLISLMFPS